jgi:hypothetical protein
MTKAIHLLRWILNGVVPFGMRKNPANVFFRHNFLPYFFLDFLDFFFPLQGIGKSPFFRIEVLTDWSHAHSLRKILSLITGQFDIPALIGSATNGFYELMGFL